MFFFTEGDKICPTKNADVTDVEEKKLYDAWKSMRMNLKETRLSKPCGSKKGRCDDSSGESSEDEDVGGGVGGGDDNPEEEEEEEAPTYKKRICNGEIFFMEKVRTVLFSFKSIWFCFRL